MRSTVSFPFVSTPSWHDCDKGTCSTWLLGQLCNPQAGFYLKIGKENSEAKQTRPDYRQLANVNPNYECFSATNTRIYLSLCLDDDHSTTFQVLDVLEGRRRQKNCDSHHRTQIERRFVELESGK